jgi:PAS domain S-box-containing protein
MKSRDPRGTPATRSLGARRAARQAASELVRLRGLVEDLDAIVWEVDAGTGEFSFVSEGATTVVGFTPDQWLGDPGFWIDHVHEEDRQRTVEEFRRASSVPGALHEIEYRFLARGGREIWLRQVGHVVTDLEGGPTVVRGLMHDITSRKAVEEQHRDAEARYRALVEQLRAIVYTEPISSDAGEPDDEMTVMYVSPRVRELLGISPTEWMQDPGLWLRAIHPDDRERVRELDREADRTMDPFIAEYRMIARDGRVIWIHDEASVLFDDAGNALRWQGVMIDITEQRRAADLERDLGVERATAQRLREADEMKNTFLQAVSHDLRTPLAAILGLAVTLGREDIDLEPGEVHDFADRIAANARKLDRLVQDLLDLDRLSRGIIEPAFEAADVGELALELLRDLDPSVRRRVEVDVDRVIVGVDRRKVERIVANLLGNSAKHAPPSSRIWARVHPHDGGVLITVEDDGPGVPREIRERIFEPFRRGPGADEHTPGVGIGLSLVRRFAELQGGRAWVEERTGGGASFHVYLPDARRAGVEVVDELAARDGGGGPA